MRDYDNRILMSASPTREVVTTTVMTLMEVIHVPAVMATSVIVIDTHEKNNNRHLLNILRTRALSSPALHQVIDMPCQALFKLLSLAPTLVKFINVHLCHFM